jgi:GT2 family glycosyltransferase
MLPNLVLRAKGFLMQHLLPAGWAIRLGLKPNLPVDPVLLVNSLYRTAFGRLADPGGLANRVRQLQSRASLQALAQELAASPEFQARHGPSQEVDTDFLEALYRDGLGRPLGLEDLAFWLTQGDKRPTRPKVLATLAGSDEAIARVSNSDLQGGMDYNRWVAAFDTISNTDRAVIRAHIAALPFCPVISVVMPMAEVSEVALRESVNSVVRQLYPNWELCIAVDEAVEGQVRGIVGSLMEDQIRARLVRVAGRLGSASPQAGLSRPQAKNVALLNAALSQATGEFVTFLQVGDLLAEHALYEAALAIGGNWQPEIVYTDLDYINSAGQRHNPWFKPGWDPDLLLAQDYFNGLVIYRRTMIEAVGGVRAGFEGAEFYDLALRLASATSSARIVHIPAILYHRREGGDPEVGRVGNATLPAGEPVALETRPYRRAVRDHLGSRGYREALVEPAPHLPGAIRVTWPVPKPEPLVSVIIPTRDRADLLAECIDGVLHRTDYSNVELLIVDNESVEPATLALLDGLTKGDSRVRVLYYPGPFNYSALNNAAAREAKGAVLLLLNNDIGVIESGWLREMVSQALRSDVGVVGAKLLYANRQVQHGGIVLGPAGAVTHVHRHVDRNDPGYFGQLALSRTLSAVTGACFAVRRAVFFEVGGLDESDFPVTFNDIDFCLRVADYGYRVVWTPYAELFHVECASRGFDDDPINSARFLRERTQFYKTWGYLVDSADPFHNPNLLFAGEHLEVPAWPRREKPWRDLGKQILSLQHEFHQKSEVAIRATHTESAEKEVATHEAPEAARQSAGVEGTRGREHHAGANRRG